MEAKETGYVWTLGEIVVHPVHAHVFLHAFSWQSTIHYQGKLVYVKNCLHLQLFTPCYVWKVMITERKVRGKGRAIAEPCL